MSKALPPKNGFRQDINGLRAWAVIAVILYHFRVDGFGGGFVGVDIFFVISGFLMTQIIVQGALTDNFRLWNFYKARARRIIPALAVLCAVVLALTWFLLAPDDYKKLSSHVMSSLLFISNIRYNREAGYFDAESYEKWLLHTWSLSVEWQFYLLFPLFLILVRKFSKNSAGLLVAVAAGFLLSCAWSLINTADKPTESFYLLPTRAWEMLTGGLVFFFSRYGAIPAQFSRWIEWLGFALIVVSILGFSAQTPWPGSAALLPVSGAALVLMSGGCTRWLTTHPIAQWLGNCSYSLYLWHWPIVVLLVYLGWLGRADMLIGGLLATFLLGWLSYRFVEEPARRRNKGNLSPFLWIAGVVLVILFAAWVHRSAGIPSRLAPDILVMAASADDTNPRLSACHRGSFPIPECTYGGKQFGAIVIGDSHAASIMRVMEKALPSTDLHVLDWSMSSCPTIMGGKFSPEHTNDCPKFMDWALEKQRSLPEGAPMIIMNRTSAYAFGQHNGATKKYVALYFGDHPVPVGEVSAAHIAAFQKALVETACRFAEKRKVYLVRPIPEMPVNVPKAAYRQMMLGGQIPDISISLEANNQRHAAVLEAQDVAARQCNVGILDPLPYLCPNGRCMAIKDGRSLYYDDDHLSEFGASQLLPMFRSVFANKNADRN